MLVAWRSSGNANYELYYGDTPASQPNMLTSSNTTEHGVSITGLDPYTKYYYKICNTGGSPCTNVEYFYTAKPDTELSTDILVFGDCGMNNNPQKNLASNMLAASNNDEFDFGLVCGDVTQQDGTDYDTYYFDIYKDILKNRCFYTTIGNHDLYGYPSHNGTAQQYLDDFYLFTNNPQSTEEYYSFEYGNAKIIALHVNFDNDYMPGSPQYEWLINELECRTTEWVFVYFHQPPFTNAWDLLWYVPFQPFFQYDGEDEVRQHLVPVFENYEVDMVFNGHMHGYERGQLNGVHYVTSGGGGGNLDSAVPNNWSHISVQNFIHHYLLVNINGMTVDVTAVDENDNVVDNFTLSKNSSTALVPAWTVPTNNLCEGDPTINLNTLLHPNATTNGDWSGAGVTGNTFDPTGLSGNIPVTYTLGSGSCTKELTQDIVIEAIPNVTWTSPSTAICNTDAALDLTTLLDPTADNTGTWSGTGVTGTSFDPSGLTGSIAVTYSVNSSCPNSLTQNIMVGVGANVTWMAPSASLCASDAAIDLMTLLDPAADNTGAWSGAGVTGSNFDPTGLTGNIPVTYTVNGASCPSSLTQNIVVETAPNVTWTVPSTTICAADGVIDLMTLLDAGADNTGVWSGTGVISNVFNPAGLSGSISLTYSIFGGNCPNSLSQNVMVETSPNVAWTAPTTVICDADAAIDLMDLLDAGADNTGTWSGTGVTGTNFDPTGLSGSVALTYAVTGVSCPSSLSQNITIETTPNVAWTAPSAVICDSDAGIDLMTLLDPAASNTGFWTGAGVTGTSFDPTGLSGSIALTYAVNGANCSNSLSQNITIETTPNVSWTVPSTAICNTDTPLDLMTLLDPAADNTGFWTGAGVTGTTFDPTGLSGGIALAYTVSAANCPNGLTQTIVVEALPDVSWTVPSATVCETDAAINLMDLLAASANNTGTWSGTGVTGNNFDPSGLSGSIALTYAVNSGNCPNSLSQNILVETAPNVSWTAPSAAICDTDAAIDLMDLLDAGTDNTGVWSGAGVTGTSFDPSGLSGNIALAYTVSGANCSNDLSQNILVETTPTATWTIPSAIAPCDAPIDLATTIVGDTGGSWSGGAYINSAGIFDPAGLTAGDYSVTYTVNNGNCADLLSQNINVIEAVTASLSSNEGSLLNCDAPIDLNTLVTGTTGGIWSGGSFVSSAGIFDPTGLSPDDYELVYSVGSGDCLDQTTFNMSVNPCATSITVQLKALLQGVYDPTLGEMRTSLNDIGLLPTLQPYDVAPWNYTGLESVIGMPADVVDWVLIEAVEATTEGYNFLETQAALLRKDGTLISTDGSEGVTFQTLIPNGSYHFVVRHRNHLDVFSAQPITVPNTAPYDFTSSTTQAMGSGQLLDMNGKAALFAGDVNADGLVTVDDYNLYRSQSAEINEYVEGDCNLDRVVTIADFNLYQPNTSLIGFSEIRY